MFRVVHASTGIQDTMKLVGWMSEAHNRHPAARFIADADGLGGPVVDRARELGIPISEFHAGHRAFNHKKFVNRRSEQWWGLRSLFEAGLVDIDPEDEVLQAQLGSVKWSQDSAGRITVETKKDMKKRGLPSPDRADTLMMVTSPFDDDWAQVYTDPTVRDNTEGSLTADLLTKEML